MERDSGTSPGGGIACREESGPGVGVVVNMAQELRALGDEAAQLRHLVAQVREARHRLEALLRRVS